MFHHLRRVANLVRKQTIVWSWMAIIGFTSFGYLLAEIVEKQTQGKEEQIKEYARQNASIEQMTMIKNQVRCGACFLCPNAAFRGQRIPHVYCLFIQSAGRVAAMLPASRATGSFEKPPPCQLTCWSVARLLHDA